MTKTYQKIAYKILIVLLAVVFVMSAFSFAKASTTYSDVLDDLNSGGTFDLSKYPDDPNNYGFEVISIAESEDRELFIYVYQPADATKEFVATYINMSPFDPDRKFDNSFDGHSLYSLTLVDTDGVFDKYVVEDFVTSSELVRYYNIASIYRAYDESIDGDSSGLTEEYDNEINQISYSVGECFISEYVNGDLQYYSHTQEVIRITDMYVGNILYMGGLLGYYNRCYGHFVAFDTDREIHQLLKARVVYDITDYHAHFSGLDYRKSETLTKDAVVEVSYDDVGYNTNSGLFFSKYYEWGRIEDIDTFLKSEDNILSDEDRELFSNKKWVLRFLETEYSEIHTSNAYDLWYSEVSNVGVLELTYRTYGQTYTMGVVSNRQTSKGPIGTHDDGWLGLGPLETFLAFVLFVLLVYILWPLFPYILKGIVWIITAPFKFIGWLVNLAKDNDNTKRKRKRKGKKR